MKYIEIAQGAPNKRGQIIPLTELKKYIKPNVELYRSYYTYDEKILAHLKAFKTVRGFTGTMWLDEIVLDIDKGKSSDDEVLYRAQIFLQQLETDWKLDRNEVKIWYSGSGYHFAFPDIFRFEPSEYIADEVKATLTKYFPEMDPMPLMKPGLIRVGHTFNAKTKRYKIPLSGEELLSWTSEEIIAEAQKFGPRKVIRDMMSDMPDFSHLKVQKREKKRKVEEREEPTKIVTCSQRMFLAGAEGLKREGHSRHTTLLRMVSSWRLAGIPYEGVMALAEAWNKGSLEQADLEKHVKYTWDKGYTPGCEDEVRLKFCDPKCVHYVNKNYVLEVMDARSMEEKYSGFMKTDFSSTSFDLKEIFPGMKTNYRIFPGEHVILTGATGLGKTAFIQNICVKLTRMKILYFSLEVHERLIFRRNVQIAYGMTKEQINDHYANGGESLTDKVEHIHVMTVAPELDGMKKLIARYNPQIVVIDTIDGIQVSKMKDAISKTEALGMQLKQIATEMDTIIFSVQHITKAAAQNEKGESKELTVHSGKGSSAIEQKADRVLGLEGSRETKQRLIRSLKTRDDESFAFVVQFHADTNFRMEQI